MLKFQPHCILPLAAALPISQSSCWWSRFLPSPHPPPSPTSLPLQLFVIGFGAVGQAWLRFIKHVSAKGLLKGVSRIRYFAPEIKEKHEDGIFEFNPAPFVTRETLVPLLDTVRAACAALCASS